MLDAYGNVVCDVCSRLLAIGDHPFCPHGRGMNSRMHDGIPGGVICENYGPTPIRFDSHSERRKYMEAHGLREKEQFCPAPGTDIDPQGIPNPDGFKDAQTLANAAALICRNGQATAFDGVESGVLRNLTTEIVSDARRMSDAID